ncbi:MAG: hypothetical protein R3194_12860 [Limnobacter sp.]|nr:hypothetical protein [Limnobacter sp.]
MSSVNGFFRRNARFFWFLGALMIGGFVTIQVNKAIGSNTADYGFASDCSYFLKPTVVQEPLTREQTTAKGCTQG